MQDFWCRSPLIIASIICSDLDPLALVVDLSKLNSSSIELETDEMQLIEDMDVTKTILQGSDGKIQLEM